MSHTIVVQSICKRLAKTMNDSILQSIKEMLIGSSEYIDSDTEFDAQLILYINTALSILNQIGIGDSSGFTVTGEDETWTEFLGNMSDIEMVKSYVGIHVRLSWDPPSSSYVLNSLKDQLKELEWRLMVARDQ